MSNLDDMSNIAYKKGNWMRYMLWGVAVVCIITLIITFLNTMNSNISAAVPPGYKFSVTDYYNGDKIHTTYYVYENRIIVEDESRTNESVDRAVFVYDDVNTLSLEYDPEDTTEFCELGACQQKPKVLVVIKSILSRKVGREYIGF